MAPYSRDSFGRGSIARKIVQWTPGTVPGVHCCEVTIYLDHDSKGKGYGRALYKALENALRKIGMTNLNACIGDPISEDEYLTRNSEQFHQHMGYTKVGDFHKCGYKFGRWYDMIWMEKMIGEHSSWIPAAGFGPRDGVRGPLHEK